MASFENVRKRTRNKENLKPSGSRLNDLTEEEATIKASRGQVCIDNQMPLYPLKWFLSFNYLLKKYLKNS